MHFQYVLVFSGADPDHEQQGPVIAWENQKSIHVTEVVLKEGAPKTYLVEGVRISKNHDTDFALYVQGRFGEVQLLLSTRNAHIHPEWPHEVLVLSRRRGQWVCEEDWPLCGNLPPEIIHKVVTNGGRGLDKMVEILTPLLHLEREEAVV